MTWLRMCHRVALICNICFLIAILLLWIKQPVNPGLASLIIVMGFILSIIMNIVVNLWLLILRIAKKPVTGIPTLLIYINGGFLAIQLILLLK